MPSIFLSPSAQEFNNYYDNSGSEQYYMNLVADATMQVKNVPLKDSDNKYVLTMLPNTRQYDRFDGYTVAYEWTPVVDTAEWYLPGKVSGLIRLPVPNGVNLLKFRNM